jgi:hypothetical protein
MNDTSIFGRIGRNYAASIAICTFFVLLTAFESANAQEWRVEPELRVGVGFDDNARLESSAAEPESIEGLLLGGSLGINYATQRTTMSLTPRFRSSKYDEDADVDSDDYFLDFDLNHTTLKGEFGIRSRFASESVRTAERGDPDIDEDDPEGIPEDATDFVFINEPRNRFSIIPRWSYDVTERTSVGLRATYIDVAYDDALAGFLDDYSDSRVEGLLSRRFSPRTSGYIGVGTRQFKNKDDSQNDVSGVGALVGIRSNFSEITQVQAEIGFEDTEFDSTGESESNMVANLNVVRRLETVTFLAQYRRTVSSGGSGRVTPRDSLSFNVRKNFTERVSGGLALRAYKSDIDEDAVLTNQARDSLEFRAQLAVALSRAFSLEGNYRYSQRDRGQIDGSQNSNIFSLWLVFRPTPYVN